jgi:hypothetical protein
MEKDHWTKQQLTNEAIQDAIEQERASRPLWWDNTSYARWQGSDPFDYDIEEIPQGTVASPTVVESELEEIPF